MALLPQKFGLYAYPPEGTDLGAFAGGAAQPGGGIFWEFDEADARDGLRTRLLDQGVLCGAGPIAQERRELWDSFLHGERRPAHFRVRPLVLGPFWYMKNGLNEKILLLAGPALLASALLRLLGIETWEFALILRRRAVGVPVGIDAAAWLMLCAYAAFYGEYDFYLRAIRRQPLWPALDSRALRAGAAAAWLACAAAWSASAASVRDSFEFRLTDPSAASAPQVLRFVSETPLWRVLLLHPPRDGAVKKVVSYAGSDPMRQGFFGSVLVSAGSSLLKTGDKAKGALAVEAGAALLKRSVSSGNPEAAREFGPALARLESAPGEAPSR